MIDPNELQRTSGWGVRGCLFGAVALFAILLIALLVIAFFRFQEPPQGMGMPGERPAAPTAPADASAPER